MYKKIMLSLLLLPCMVVSKSGKEYQIEQLKKTQHDKEEKIALIIKAIDEKESFIDSISLKIDNVFDELSYETSKEIQGTLKSFQVNLKKAYIYHESIRSWFNKDFIDNDNDSALELKRLKYLLTRYVLEYMSLKNLIEQYEQCLQDLFELNCQLDELQN